MFALSCTPAQITHLYSCSSATRSLGSSF